jgi:hypothetical protein
VNTDHDDSPYPPMPPPEMLQAIGALIVTASAVNQHLAFQILRFISPPDGVLYDAWPVVAGMGFRVKTVLFRTLITRIPKQERDWLIECCDEMETLYQHRDRLGHSPFMGLTRTGRAQFQSYNADTRTGVPPQALVVTAQQVNQWARQLNSAAIELDARVSAIGLPREMLSLERYAGVAPRSSPRKDSSPPRKSRSPRTKRKKPASPPRSDPG